MIKVSVVVPIYGVEKYIEKCTRSLMEQTLSEIEILFINDATKDSSIEILRSTLADYPNRDNVRIIEHEYNKGLPAARNTGIKQSQGEYIYHCDGDDYLEHDALEKLYYASGSGNVDMVYCDYYITYSTKERYMSNPEYTDTWDYLTQGLLDGKTKYNVWNKLVKRDVYTKNDISFPDGFAMGEDMTMITIAACCKSIKYLPDALYHYVQANTNAYSRKMSSKHVSDIIHNVTRIESFLTGRSIGVGEMHINLFKLSSKMPFLLSGEKEHLNIWRNMFPECNDFCLTYKQQPLRIRLLQMFAAHRIDAVVIIHYYVFQRFLYGLIYR